MWIKDEHLAACVAKLYEQHAHDIGLACVCGSGQRDVTEFLVVAVNGSPIKGRADIDVVPCGGKALEYVTEKQLASLSWGLQVCIILSKVLRRSPCGWPKLLLLHAFVCSYLFYSDWGIVIIDGLGGFPPKPIENTIDVVTNDSSDDCCNNGSFTAVLEDGPRA
jgi:hypothetical protein